MNKLYESIKDDMRSKKSGNILKNLSYKYINDKKLVLFAISFGDNAFQFASKELREDVEVQIVAVKKNINAFLYIHGEIKSEVWDIFYENALYVRGLLPIANYIENSIYKEQILSSIKPEYIIRNSYHYKIYELTKQLSDEASLKYSLSNINLQSLKNKNKI